MRKLATSLAATAVLALPATASAHPSVYYATAKIAAKPEKQILTRTGAGNWTPTTGVSQVSDTATAAEVQDAFMSVPSIGYTTTATPPTHATAPGYDNVRVSGPDGGPYTVTFIGQLAGVNVDTLTPTGASANSNAPGQDGGAPVTYSGNPDADQALMSDQPQAVVASDGYALGYRETNGVGPRLSNGIVVGGGLLSLSKFLPSAYRASMTPVQKLSYLQAQSSIQLHATCSGVAALEDPNNVWKAWERDDNDPFYNYIPWQNTRAGVYANGALVVGFEDDPAKWIALVKSITNGLPGAPAGGVDLAKLSSVSDFTKACTDLGGKYHPADTASNLTSAVVAEATTPLNAQITTLTGQVNSLNSQVGSMVPQLATLTSENTALKAAAKAVPARKLALTLTSKKLDPAAITTMVTGTAGHPVTVRLTVSKAVAKALGLKSQTLASKTATLNSQGAALLSLKASKTTIKTLKKTKGATSVTVAAGSGSETNSSAAKLTV